MALSINELVTPCLVLNQTALDRNLRRVHTIAQQSGVQLRPHCKTAKSAEVARRATAGFSGGITVATLNEAEYFAQHGFTDITYAVNIVPSKLQRIQALRDRGITITVLSDHIDAVEALIPHLSQSSTPLPILIEIDTGTRRTGVLPDAPELIPLAKRIHESPSLDFQGLLSFGGFGYKEHSPEDIADTAALERTRILDAADRLQGAHIDCPVISVGSTPHVLCARSFNGINEIRPGVYVFGDLMMKALGVYDYEDIAVTVQATIIGHNREQNRAYIDAGALALSQDQGFDRNGLPYAKYGLIRQSDSALPYPNIGVCEVNQEHGFVECLNEPYDFPFNDFPIGSTVHVIPNHSCHTISGFDQYHVIDDVGQVIAEWPRTNGW